MRRWRTIGLIGVPTIDGRIIEGTVSLRSEQVVILRRCRREGQAGVEPDRRGVPVRVEGNRIQALLAWADRHSTPSFTNAEIYYLGDPEEGAEPLECHIRNPTLHGLGPGPSAWAELR